MLLMVASCASTPETTTGAPGVSLPSAPFAVSDVPAGYSLVGVERGRQVLPWGDDSSGTAEPFTVLAPDGETASSSRAIVVSVTGFEGYQGRLDQAVGSGPIGSRSTKFRVGGRDAVFVSAPSSRRSRTSGVGWSELLVVRGRDLAVRVRGADGSKSLFLAVERGVRRRGRTGAPLVPSPPAGYRVIGSVDGAVAASQNLDAASSDLREGTEVGTGEGNPVVHRMTWSGPDAELQVMTLPSRAAGLDALPGFAVLEPSGFTLRTQPLNVKGRPAVVLERWVSGAVQPAPASRTLYIQGSWGNLVVATTYGDAIVSVDDLVAIAESLSPTNEAAWAALPSAARASPREVAVGTAPPG